MRSYTTLAEKDLAVTLAFAREHGVALPGTGLFSQLMGARLRARRRRPALSGADDGSCHPIACEARRSAQPRRSNAERTAQTRARLMDAVVESIAEVGLARTTAPEIARRAGVTWGAVQHHFGGKDGMLVSVLDDSFRRFAERLEGIPIEGTSLEKRAALFIDRAWEHFAQRALPLDLRDPGPLSRARGLARPARLARPHVAGLGPHLAPPVRRCRACRAAATSCSSTTPSRCSRASPRR